MVSKGQNVFKNCQKVVQISQIVQPYTVDKCEMYTMDKKKTKKTMKLEKEPNILRHFPTFLIFFDHFNNKSIHFFLVILFTILPSNP